jgi:methylmalonyl-CoA mutase
LENKNRGLLDLLNRNSGFRMLILQELVTEPGTIDELALLLSQGIFTINTLLEADIPMPTILENIQLNLPLGDSYLWEICRLRCLRILFHQVVQQYGTTDYLPGSLTIQATTTDFQSPPAEKKSPKESFSTFGQNQQLLRNTVQTMAAVLGGCNIITVVPHKNGFGSNDQWSRRIARNVGHILKDESNLHKMADPVAGSYYLENLTDKMLREVWARLQQIEGSGGYLKRRES